MFETACSTKRLLALSFAGTAFLGVQLPIAAFALKPSSPAAMIGECREITQAAPFYGDKSSAEFDRNAARKGFFSAGDRVAIASKGENGVIGVQKGSTIGFIKSSFLRPCAGFTAALTSNTQAPACRRVRVSELVVRSGPSKSSQPRGSVFQGSQVNLFRGGLNNKLDAATGNVYVQIEYPMGSGTGGWVSNGPQNTASSWLANCF